MTQQDKDRIEKAARVATEKIGEHKYASLYAFGFIAGTTYENERSKWISVRDSKPDNSNDILMCGANGIEIGRYDGESFVSDLYNMPYASYVITHWQPLPAPPEK